MTELTRGFRQSGLSLAAATQLLARAVTRSAIAAALPNVPPGTYWANRIRALREEQAPSDLPVASQQLLTAPAGERH